MKTLKVAYYVYAVIMTLGLFTNGEVIDIYTFLVLGFTWLAAYLFENK